MKLFDDDETENVNISKIEIDTEYARRYEHNKKRDDLQKLEKMIQSGQIEESDVESKSESSDKEEDNKFNKKEDIKLFENLIKIKDRDPSVYQPVDLFESESDSDSDNDMIDKNKDRSKKPKYLKDVVAIHLLEGGPEFEDVESNKMKKTYIQEQEELKKAFFDEVKNMDDEDGGALLKEKENKDENDGDGDDGEFQKKLGEYFGPDAALDENSKFLKDYFEKQMWIDREKKNSLIVDDDVDVDDDNEEVWRQEDFEASYNFRYEENAGDRVMGHSRTVEDSVRKEKNSRKEQRKNKLERMKIAEMERKEELKHLKNLKKKEMDEKMKKVLDVAGLTNKDDFGLDPDDLEKDFDPAEYDKKMKKLFGDEYYNTNDPDPEFCSDDDGDIEKPDFDKEDELLGLPKGWGAIENDDGFLAARKRALEKIAENDDHDEDEEEEEEEEDDEDGSDIKDNEEKEERDDTGTEDSNDDDDDDDDDKEEEEQRGTAVEKNEEIVKKRKRKEKISLVQKAYEAMLEEYYKLDYEDTVGDLKTRFKYAKVKPNRFGLKTDEVLMLDDKELNQYVSVKKIAAYREDEWKVPNSKRKEYKEKVKELRRGKSKNNHGKTSKTKSSRDNGDKTKSVSDQEKKPALEETNIEVANLSRRKKRKDRLKELKPSKTRMAAYQNIQPKKRKH